MSKGKPDKQADKKIQPLGSKLRVSASPRAIEFFRMISCYNNITGVILVGGKSRSMGQDKAFLMIEGLPVIERIVQTLQGCFRQLLLVGDRPERFTQYHLPVVPDIYPGSSLGGLYTGLQGAESMKRPPVVSFVAHSGTGKTTLLEQVIPILKARGYRVGAIKHDAHRFEIDYPGKDSHRLTVAGAGPAGTGWQHAV